MNKQAKLYIIQGFIGAGKSTFSKKLAEQTQAVHLNPDEWVTNYFSKEQYMSNWNECFDRTLELLWNKTKEYLSAGQDVIFDMGFWQKKDRIFARQLAKEYGAQLVHYYLYVPDEILKQRIIATRPPEWAKIHLQNFESNKAKFELPDAEEACITIDNY